MIRNFILNSSPKNPFFYLFSLSAAFFLSCNDEGDDPQPETFQINEIRIDGVKKDANSFTEVNTAAPFYVRFSAPVDRNTIPTNIELLNSQSRKSEIDFSYENSDSTLKIRPKEILSMYSDYKLNILPNLKSKQGTLILTGKSISIATGIDSTDKFVRIPDDELLELVQKQTFKYFWDFGHPVSGMARERSTSGNTVTTGGTGFGVMAIVVATERNFVTRKDAVERIQKIVTFLKNECTSYHGAFAHWVNGATGETQPFGEKDNGADLVETSFLMQGLLTARQYFNGSGSDESQLRNDINDLWKAVDWKWFQKNNENVLYWHWSPNYNWDMNLPIRGWNECLITYVLAASSPTNAISRTVYEQGWARNGAMKNGQSYYGYTLPVGSYGDPMFFSHYSFLGLNPEGLSDQYADYAVQTKNHTLINYSYCVENSKNYKGYSQDCWGLTASDGNTGYSAHSPTNDKGVIAPTAALSSMPYAPDESMRALRFFYYKMGDRLWKEYGFIDAFNLSANWFDTQFLAIDQGPIVVMIENYRTGLIWNLFMTCPEVKDGLNKLGFQYKTL